MTVVVNRRADFTLDSFRRVAFGREEQGLAYAFGSAMPGVFQVRPDILKEIPQKDTLLSGKTQSQR